MKLATFRYKDQDLVGILSSCETKVYPLSTLGLHAMDMNDFIDQTAKDGSLLGSVAGKASKLDATEEAGLLLSDVQLLSPIPFPKQDIICLGINYAAHAVESARFAKDDFGGERTYPLYFSKRVNEAVAPKGVIHMDEKIMTALDYEVELAVVIGRDAKNVSPENAFDYILGYTILNDVTDRTVQTRHKQWYFGKSLDNFTPIGPYIVTEDCFERPPVLKIQTTVNDELRQNSTTADLIFGIPYVISELSAGMTLKAGTIIATGTPEGVGMGFQPPRFLSKGDKVVCTIEGIGDLENTIG
ncbi:MAG: fumarylacetoacetate hydrolase family protein [Eubacteriales bacterium]|nr:fumarylacetoacetate hydrolase family protein [Eubacteriales bacterium]MDD4389902.1 fumarylacetoacetate hydrolase family protein [Eubacteriales bacterium]